MAGYFTVSLLINFGKGRLLTQAVRAPVLDMKKEIPGIGILD